MSVILISVTELADTLVDDGHSELSSKVLKKQLFHGTLPGATANVYIIMVQHLNLIVMPPNLGLQLISMNISILSCP
jgi:hypothetical protein